MTTEQTSSNAAVAQAVAKTARAAIQALTMAEAERLQYTRPKVGGPIIGQLTFNCNSIDKYAELRNFRLEVKSMLQSYRISNVERVPIIKNLLGRQGLQLLEYLTQAEQKACNTE